MVTLYVNDKKVSAADRWGHCSTGVFQRIITEWDPELPILKRDRLKLFGILTGTDFKGVAESQSETLEAAVWQVTNFVYYEQMDFDALPRPKTLTVKGITVVIPEQLGRMTIGQNIHVRQALMSGGNPAEQISLACAIYLQPLLDASVVDGKETPAEFNYERALQIEEHIKAMPITEIYPVGFFFSSRLAPYGRTPFKSLRLKIQRIAGNALRSLSLLMPRGSIVISKSLS